MSTRSRRARGRPPKTPLPTNRTNFLRKPKAYQNQELNLNSSGSASPVSLLKGGRSDRARGRAAAHKGRNFVSQLIAEDDEISSLPEFEDRSSDITDIDNTDTFDNGNDDGSDASFCENSDGESSDNESLSTVSSSVSRRRLLLKRPKTPDLPDDKEIPLLELPASATDLLLPSEHVLQAMGVYEVLRHFRTILRLSPFTFEDFCACLLSDEQSNLLAETHMTLLKALLREEDNSNTTFGPQDLKDSVNVSLYFFDPMTWPETVRAYLDSEKHPEYRVHLSILSSPDYPFVPYAEKLKVLQTLTDLFLATTKVREEIINEGNIHYDDHCRACHKLGDLLCCETCSAVYHLGCVEPPMQEVPEDDWLCSVCRAHQVKGVTDCVSEAEKSGLLCRQEPVGYDRHARKYWFLCRRIIVEGEKEVRYYSTKYQLDELLESLDIAWEPDLISFINEMKDDILKQMSYTEELTVAVKGSRKSVLEIENAQLMKIQAERTLKREKEEAERKAKEEEERKRKVEEEKRKNKENEDSSDREEDLTDSEMKDSRLEENSEETVESEAVVTTKTEQVSNTVTKSGAGDETTEMVETTTITTSITTIKSTTVTTTASTKSAEEEEPPSKKAKLDEASSNDGSEGNSVSGNSKDSNDDRPDSGSAQDGDKSKADKIVLSSKSALAEAIKNSTDGKPKVISLQSLLPSARQTLMSAVDKNGDDAKTEGPTKTVLLVNREGGKVTLQVSRQPVSKDEQSGTTSVTQTSTSTTVNASATESRKMLTRSKTGSLTPKLFTDSITMTTTSMKAAGKSTDEILVLNKDGEITRVNRGKISLASSLVQQSIYFKLGSEGSYKQYQNQYTTNTLALNKHQHYEERDKRRHLSHKFSLTQNSEFKWNGNVMGNRMSTLATLRLTVSQLEANIQTPFLHSNWPNHRQNWQKAVQICQTPRDFALALTILEACIKPCAMNPVWHEALGHLRLNRITMADREEWKKKEKEQRRRKEDEEEVRPVVWIKYTMGLKHQVWKQKGEEYRVTGGNGWQWLSVTRNHQEVPQDSVGLRLVAHRLRNRRVRTAKASNKSQKADDGEEEGETEGKVDVKSEEIAEDTVDKKSDNKDEKKDEQGVGEENMDTDEQKEEKDSDSKDDTSITCKMETEEVSEVESKTENAEDESKVGEKSGSEEREEAQKETMEGLSESKADRKDHVKDSVTKVQRGKASFDNYLAYMKKKYIEDPDCALALELLKQHPVKVDVDLINVSDAMQKRTYYAKTTKPYSKLDNLLERRLKQDEFERKQRLTIETQIALKQKLTQAIQAAQKLKDGKEQKTQAENEKLTNGDVSDESPPSSLSSSLKYSCYSLLCRTEGDKVGSCYSPFCRTRQSEMADSEKMKGLDLDGEGSKADSVNDSESLGTGHSSSKESSPDNLTNEDTMDSHLSQDACDKDEEEDEEMKDLEEDNEKDMEESDEKENVGTEENVQSGDGNVEDEDVDIEGDANKESGSGTPVKTSSSTGATGHQSSEGKKKDNAHTEQDSEKKDEASTSEENPLESSSPKRASVSDIVKNLVIKTMAEKAVASGSGKGSLLNTQALTAAVANISMDDLKARLPPKRGTSEKFKLAKFTRIGGKKKVSKNGRLPRCHKFETASKKKSVFILDRNEVRKMARLGAKRESLMFNYNCKMNNVCWIYPCPRPFFKTAWRYRTMTIQSLSAAALQLRILWACIRWDDMAAKPPAGGTNTVSTETEITTTELLKRREVGVDGLRSEFLVRKIVVPLGVPDKPKEKYTPQRSGLRERKRVEAVRQTEPSVTEVWVPEEVLELWEIKQFGEKLEKQRLALQEKAEKAAASQQTIVTSQQSTAQIKAQMEQQLKQQRLALAQKRIQENQGIKITTGNNPSSLTTLASASTTTIIINNTTQLGKPGTTFKTLTVSSPSSLLSQGVIKTMQPKTIITNAGSLLGTQLRPGIRLQIPAGIQLRPQNVALAPKPGTTVATTSGVSTITRLISPATNVARVVTPSTPQATKTQTIQIRPQTPGQPVQTLHFTQTPGGQLQVRGLLPGQIIQRMPDGKLQIITLNSSATATGATTSAPAPTAAPTTNLSPAPAAAQQQTPRPTINIRPQTIMVSPPPGSTTTATPTITQNRLVIPAQLASSLSLAQGATPTSLTVPAIRQVLASSGANTPSKPIIVNRPGGPQIISAQNLATVLGSQSNQTLSVSSPSSLVSTPASVAGALNSAVVISAPGVVNNASTPTIISSAVSGVTTVLVNNSQPTALLPSQNQSGQQTIISTLKPSVISQTPSGAITTTTITTTAAGQPGTSLLGGQIISGTSLLQKSIGGTSLLNLNPASGSGGTITITGTGASATSQIPKLLASPPAGAQIITRPIGSTQPQLVIRPGTSVLTGAGQAKVITAQQLRGLATSPIQLKPAPASLSPIKTVLSPQSSGAVISAGSGPKTLTAVRSLTPQLTLQTSTGQQLSGISRAVTSILPQGLTLTSSPEAGSAAATVVSPNPTTSPGAGAPKYAITPQVVEQVVRQALLQNQTPEIQQKLLAMQKQIQQQQQTQPVSAITVTGSAAAPLGSTSSVRRTSQSSITSLGKVSVPSGNEQSRSKVKGMTQEQKEEQSRNSICGQVMKSILDRIEREEKLEQRNKKKQESAEEKQKRLAAMNQQKALYKHKEALKKEILRKRSLMEKNLQQEIYNEMADKLKKTKVAANVAKSPQSGSASTVATPSTAAQVTLVTSGKVKKSTETPQAHPGASESKSTARKRKQKIISTGVKGLNPKEKLYCICKTPYDDSKFYIGCDLCSNWFHGACVNISEDRARFIDSYICEDCRKQQENISEELYCLCRTPYDENQFYIGCDRCQDWFHGYCVGISKHEADSIDVYVCPNCQKEEVADPIAQKPLTSSEYQQLLKLLKDLQVHKMAWPFLHPVDPKDVPDYYDVVAEPMDLTIVEAKLNAKAYHKLNDFMKDVTKIFDNCRLYNPVDTPYFQCAEVVETYFAQRVKTLRSANKL